MASIALNFVSPPRPHRLSSCHLPLHRLSSTLNSVAKSTNGLRRIARLTVHDGYVCLQSTLSVDPTRYPHPIVPGRRVINGLGHTHDIPALESVYSIAQQVLFALFHCQPHLADRGVVPDRGPEIIAHSHAGDMGGRSYALRPHP